MMRKSAFIYFRSRILKKFSICKTRSLKKTTKCGYKGLAVARGSSNPKGTTDIGTDVLPSMGLHSLEEYTISLV